MLHFKQLVGWLVGFYGISTLAGYLMPNLVYTDLLNTYDLQINSWLEIIFKQAIVHLFAHN